MTNLRPRRLFLAAAFAAAALLAWPIELTAAVPPTPTPTPAARQKKKLGGGTFGATPAPTPAAGSDGGSLAGVVRKTQDETTSPGSKKSRRIVITNESLRRRESPPSDGSSITITGSAGSKPVVTARPTPEPEAAPEYRDATGRTEQEWRERAASTRERAEKAEADVTAAQNEVRRLENDFYAWSDGNYRERVIRPAWDQAREKLKALESAAAEARQAVDELEEEARKAGAPPGWLR